MNSKAEEDKTGGARQPGGGISANAMKSGGGTGARTRAAITGVRPDATGIFLTLRCAACGNERESYQPTIAGFACGQHACGECAAIYEVEQEDLEDALDAYCPRGSLEDMAALTAAATRGTETWQAGPEIAAALADDGVCRGPVIEGGRLAFLRAGVVGRLGSGDLE